MPAQGSTLRGLLGAGAGLLGFSAIAGLLVTVMVAPAIAVTGVAANSTISVFEELPDYIEITTQHQRNTFVAINDKGEEVHIADWYEQNREEVSLSQIDDDLKWAAIDGEDRRFEEHGGVDLPSLIRAAIGQLTKTSSSGASTLTMQLVRNILVLKAENNPDFTDEERAQAVHDATYPNLNRKLKEMKLAISLEKRYTKDQILEAYLNIVLMGQTTYGVQAGAQRYFGTDASDVTPAQAASLIAIVQNPSLNGLYTPDNFEENQKRRDVILGWMHSQGHLSDAEYREALATPVDETTVSQNSPRSGCSSAPAAYRFPCDFALKTILNGEVPSLGATKQAQRERWAEGGLTVVLTINPKLQSEATKIVRNIAPADETRMELGASASSVEVDTGRIVIMAQNKHFDDTGNGDYTTTAVNFNADYDYGGSVGFQPGSTYKPYTLLAFLAAGHGLNETFDAGIRSIPFAQFSDRCAGSWGNKDYTFRNDSGEKGLYNVTRGTAGSVNSVFLQMATETDLCDIAEIAESIGVHRAGGPDVESPDLLTGPPACLLGGCGINVAPLTQAGAYAAIANKGTYCKPIIIDKIIVDDDTELAGQDAQCGPSLVTPAVANTATYAMQAVMTGTAGRSNPRDGTPYMGKTGTTNDAIHTWMAGSSSRISTAVWVGNIEKTQSMRRIYVKGRYGGDLRHFIFKPLAQAIDKVYPGKAFPGPDPALMRGVQVFVPEGLIGTTPEVAQAAIEQARLSFEDAGEIDSDLPVGTVAKTDPAPGEEVPKGTVVRVFTSNGQAAPVPDVSIQGYSFPDAVAVLNAGPDGDGNGFPNVVMNCVVPDPDSPPDGLLFDVVFDQDPAAGTVVNRAQQITLSVRQASCP